MAVYYSLTTDIPKVGTLLTRRTIRRLKLSMIIVVALTACESPLLGIEVTTVKKRGLPDPLHFIDGNPVTSLADWTDVRRAELRELFQYYMYGYYPDTPELVFTTVKEDPDAIPGLASYREVEIGFLVNGKPLQETLTLAIFLPKGVEKPPVYLTINRCGNHSIHSYDGISFPASGAVICSNTGQNIRGRMTNFWSVELLLSRGYGVVSFLDDDLCGGREADSTGLHSA